MWQWESSTKCYENGINKIQNAEFRMQNECGFLFLNSAF
jgi:hypothetical protein